MIKKIIAACLFLFLSVSALRADWKTEVSNRLGLERNFSAALSYLREAYPSIDALEKPNALALLAFFCRKNNDLGEEARYVIDYFETYREADPMFEFLEEDIRRDFVIFWGKWTSLYPLITEAALLARPRDEEAGPPAFLEIGITLRNRAYYKLSGREGTIEGGLFEPGFHIVKIPLSGDYIETGRVDYDLDLKAGSLVIRKRLTLDIAVKTVGRPLSLVPTPSKNRNPAKENPEKTILRPVEGEISIYVGDTLILTSKKLTSSPASLTFKIPGPSAPGTKPYLAPDKNTPQFNTVSILDAVTLAISTIKDLVKKKKHVLQDVPKTYQKTLQLSFPFSKNAPEGGEIRCRALISIRTANAVMLNN